MTKDSGTEGGDDDGAGHELVMEFTPPPGFNIHTMAKQFSLMMEETNQSLLIRLPHVAVEFEPGCTPEEIVDGYNLGLQHQSKVQPSNSNSKKDES